MNKKLLETILRELEKELDNPNINAEMLLKEGANYERAKIKYALNKLKEKYGIK